jgi:hypothetical protein
VGKNYRPDYGRRKPDRWHPADSLSPSNRIGPARPAAAIKNPASKPKHIKAFTKNGISVQLKGNLADIPVNM